ncbi:hypothetical protein ABIB38_001772 [Massilia sp. UYP11]|uniref:hypothetical protein n=1 Tax=Massilia sp. UYP11 TaxID=1756385 RepID=UPI003D2193C5
MSKMTDIFDIWNFLTTHIVTGLIPFISIVLLVLYALGHSRHKEVVRRGEEEKFTIKAFAFSPALSVFNWVNGVLDFAVGGILKAVHKFAWVPCMNILDKVLPDSAIEKAVQATVSQDDIASLSFKSRFKMAEDEFDKGANAFWWNKERAPDFRNISPVISGRWFNGKPVENYMHMFAAPRNFYQVVKAGVLVFIAAAVVSFALYRPDATFGFTPDRVLAEQIVAVTKNEAVFGSNQVTEDERFDSAYSMVIGADYTIFPRILFALFFAVGVAGVFIERRYVALYKKHGVPFVKDNYEEFAFQNRAEEIQTYKRNLSAGNTRATGFDRVAPLIVAFESTGAFEERGMVNSRRKGDPVVQSLTDLAQNTQVYGGTGAGKSELILKPMARAFCELKNQYIGVEEAYSQMFDLRTDRLTQVAIDAGCLKHYRKLAEPKISVAMAIMDIKSVLWKDLMPIVEKNHLQDKFQIIGADAEAGELAVDLLSNCDPEKFVAFINSLESQMGGEMSNDFWKKSGLKITKHISDIAYLFARTTGGRMYMRNNNTKVWSPAFIQNLAVYDSTAELLHSCVKAIQYDLEHYPERLADVFTLERVRSVEFMLTEWETMPSETKGGIQATLSVIMAGFENAKLSVFMTGVGDNIVEVGELWNKLTAFNLDTDRYSNAGKFVLLFIKTLMFEEAAKRQMRYSTKLIQIANRFKSEFPSTFKTTPAIEVIPVSWLGSNAQELVGKYQELCDIIQGVDGEWVVGTYSSKLKEFAKIDLEDKNPESVHQMARDALSIAARIYELEPRHATECVSMGAFDPSVLNAVPSDTKEEAKRKEELMHLYYQYEDATTRVRREHMLFMGDEYQQLITVDKTGGCYNDSNFPNISRSTSFKYFVATQTYAAYVEKVGKEVADNFLNQMRSQYYLATEDKSTGEMVEGLSGKADLFDNPFKGIELKASGKLTGVKGYNNFNAFVSRAVSENRQNAEFNKSYKYDHDIFTVAEPLEVSANDIEFDGIVSSIFNGMPKLELASMKNHFLDESKIPAYRRTGSASQGYQDNKDAIQSAWAESRDKMNTSHQQFLTQNIKKDVSVYSATEFVAQGNIHAFVIVQRAGVTIKDQVIVAPESYYKT